MTKRTTRIVATVAVIVLVTLAWLPAGVIGRFFAYVALIFLPGLGLYSLLERRPSVPEALVAALALSPVITCGIAALVMVTGTSAETATRWVLVTAALVGVAAALSFRPAADASPRDETTGRQWAVFGIVVFSTLVLVGILPATSEWWRVRSDAWFHAAVVAQVDDFGLPPGDPYFAGFTLQYMWFYHVLLLVLSKATGMDAFRVATILNLQSLVVLFLATFLLATVFVRDFGRRLGSCVMVVFGLNGLFWLFLPPLALARAFTGEVRGLDELARVFSLSPFDMYTSMRFLKVFYNQDWLLDKYMVATAFGIALGCMVLFWYAASAYLKTRRRFLLVAVLLSLIGMLGFHTLFGVITCLGAAGGLGLSFLFRRRIDDYRFRPAFEIAAACVVAVAVVSPYLHSITHAKQSANAFPFSWYYPVPIGIIISSASAAVLAAFQRRFFTCREASYRYVQFATLTTAVCCTFIVLPQHGSADKIPLFVFFPLAVVGGWTLVDWIGRGRTAAARVGIAVLLAVLFLVPVNAISFGAFFNTPEEVVYTDDEEAAAAWVRDNTSREAVFIDRDDAVFLLVAGPRRYYCGRWAYAYQWGYDKLAMAGRMHARDALYRAGPLDLTTLRLLGEAPWPLYVVDRRDRRSGDAALAQNPDLFEKVFSAGDLDIYRVDTTACRAAADELRRSGAVEVPPDELIRESGL